LDAVAHHKKRQNASTGVTRDSKSSGSRLGQERDRSLYAGTPALVISILGSYYGGVACIFVPLVCISGLFATVGRAYSLWFPTRQFRGLIFPAISELGVAQPQKSVYQVGFVTVGLLLALHVYVLSQIVIPKLVPSNAEPERTKAASNCIWYGYQAAFGAGLQGLFTLELQVSPQSIIHWVAAVLFMMGSMHHAQLSSNIYDDAIAEGALPAPVVWAATLRSAILKYSTVVMFLPVILCQVFASSFPQQPPQQAEGGDPQMPGSPTMMNAMGLMQWFIILQFAFYFASYAVDLAYLNQ